MTQSKEENIDHSKSYEMHQKKTFNKNTILNILVFILILNQFNKKGYFSSDGGVWQEDDYTVTMGNNPAFPLEKEKGENTKNNTKSILNLENEKDLYSMFNTLKPHMSTKNRKIINIFEKYQALMEDLNDFSTNPIGENDLLDLSRNEQKNIINFLDDIKPFIQPEYHGPIQQFSDKIDSILDIQKNITNLQNTFTHIHNVSDDTQKINNLVDALQPFMDENQKKTIEQLKNISQVLEMSKMVEDLSQNSNQSKKPSKDGIKKEDIKKEDKDQKDKNAQLMEILDILDAPPKNKDIEEDNNKEQPNQKPDKTIESAEIQEPQYEEIFEENISFEED